MLNIFPPFLLREFSFLFAIAFGALLEKKRSAPQMNHQETVDALQERLDAYRKRSIKLASELDMERKEKSQLQARLRELQQHIHHAKEEIADESTPGHPSACSSCATSSGRVQTTYGDYCVHKSALATHIIDLTFDSHKDLLRNKLRAATEELERLRGGACRPGEVTNDQDSASLREDIGRLKSEVEDQKMQISALRRELCDAKIDALKQRTSGGGESSLAHTTASREDHRNTRALEEQAAQALVLQLALRTLAHVEQQGTLREELLAARSYLLIEGLHKVAEATPEISSLPSRNSTDPLERHFPPESALRPSVVDTALRYRPHVPQVRTAHNVDEGCREATGGNEEGAATVHVNRKRNPTQQPRPLRGLL